MGVMSSPTREQFVEQVLGVVAERFPLVKIARGEESFSVRVNGHAASLENLYRTVLLRPDDSRHQIERWVVELIRAAEGTPDRTSSFDDLKDYHPLDGGAGSSGFSFACSSFASPSATRSFFFFAAAAACTSALSSEAATAFTRA